MPDSQKQQSTSVSNSQAAFSPCQLAVGSVVADVITLALGAIGVRGKMTEDSIEGFVRAMNGIGASELNMIQETIAMIADSGTSVWARGLGVWTILRTIKNGGVLGAVFSAFVDTLSWWDAILYGVTGMATIVAALATDGAAFIAEVVLLLTGFGFLVNDSIKAAQACGAVMGTVPALAQAPIALPADSPVLPFEPRIALRTSNGHSLTVVNNGGLNSAGACAFNTDARQVGPNEKFTLVPIDANQKTFALKTAKGNFITAVNGGGMGGPNDATSTLHTDATWIGPWETLIVEQQEDGSFAFCTTNGFYLSAVNGGGWGEPANRKPIHTDATKLGPWETFTMTVMAQQPLQAATA